MTDSAFSALERRVAILEAEVAALRHGAETLPIGTARGDRGSRMLERARQRQEAIAAAAAEAIASVGVGYGPMNPEEVQRMMIAEGVQPEDNSFSRDIKSMREE